MHILSIQNLPQHLHQSIRRLAAQNELSLEAEVRTILTNAFNDKKSIAGLQQRVDQLYQQSRSLCRETRA